MSNRPSEVGSRSGPADCASTLAAVERFVRDRGEARTPAVREHLKACVSCREAYREHVEGLARLARAHTRSSRGVGGAGRRTARAAGTARPEQSAAERAHPDEPSHGVQAAAAALQRAKGPKARRRHAARLLLAPAVLALGFLVVQRLMPGESAASGHGFEAMPIVTSLAGNVQVADRRLAPDESALLARGASCRTAPGSRARIAAGRAELELGPETYVQVEAKAPPRFRLALGEVTVHGACTITTVHGVAEIGEGGELSIELGWNGIAFERGAGDVRWYDADGERALGDGAAFELARALPGLDGREGRR